MRGRAAVVLEVARRRAAACSSCQDGQPSGSGMRWTAGGGIQGMGLPAGGVGQGSVLRWAVACWAPWGGAGMLPRPNMGAEQDRRRVSTMAGHMVATVGRPAAAVTRRRRRPG